MKKLDPHHQWLKLNARVRSRLRYEHSDPELQGRLLLRLLQLAPLKDDLAASPHFAGIPLGGLGTSASGFQCFDLGQLLKAWDRGIFCASCPVCQKGQSLYIYFIGASPLSGASHWRGVCLGCQKVHLCASHSDSKCPSCGERHESASRDMIGYSRVTGNSSFTRWTLDLGRFREKVGGSLVLAKVGQKGE
jgi:hypothetical protein